MVMLRTSPGPIKSVGCGGAGTRVDCGTSVTRGSSAPLVTSTTLNGNPAVGSVEVRRAECRISRPVGPLTGKVEQAPRMTQTDAIAVQRSSLLRALPLLNIYGCTSVRLPNFH